MYGVLFYVPWDRSALTCGWLLQLDNLEFDGEEINGLARCPFDSKQTNVALFAGKGQETNPRTNVLILVERATNVFPPALSLSPLCLCHTKTMPAAITTQPIRPYKRRETMCSVCTLLICNRALGLFQRGSCTLPPLPTFRPVILSSIEVWVMDRHWGPLNMTPNGSKVSYLISLNHFSPLWLPGITQRVGQSRLYEGQSHVSYALFLWWYQSEPETMQLIGFHCHILRFTHHSFFEYIKTVLGQINTTIKSWHHGKDDVTYLNDLFFIWK